MQTTVGAGKSMRRRLKADLPPVPPAAEAEALVGPSTCAAIGEVSVERWRAWVRAGVAPAPVIQQTRMTRWNLAAVRRFWADLAERGSPPEARDRLLRAAAAGGAARARKAGHE